MKTRKIKGSGITLYQLISSHFVFTLSNNTHWMNGPKGWKIRIKKRQNTEL